MHITSLSVDGCEYYLTVSFSSTLTVMYIIELCNLTTQNVNYGLSALLYG